MTDNLAFGPPTYRPLPLMRVLWAITIDDLSDFADSWYLRQWDKNHSDNEYIGQYHSDKVMTVDSNQEFRGIPHGVDVQSYHHQLW